MTHTCKHSFPRFFLILVFHQNFFLSRVLDGMCSIYLMTELFLAEVVHNGSQGFGEVSHRAPIQQHILLKATLSPFQTLHCVLIHVFTIMQGIMFCSGLNDHSERSGNALR